MWQYLTLAVGVSAILSGCPDYSKSTVTTSVQFKCNGKCSEVSGIAVSRQKYKGNSVMWGINDGSDGKHLLLFDMKTGSLIKRYRNTFGSWSDVEDLSLAPCGGSSTKQCLYQADVGNNCRCRTDLRMHIVEEPQISDSMSTSDETVSGSVHPIKYPSGSYDCESIFVDPTGDSQGGRAGDMYFIDKDGGSNGVKGSDRVRLYKYPYTSRTSNTFTLQVAGGSAGSTITEDTWTAADMSLDGRWLTIAGYHYARVFDRKTGTVASALNNRCPNKWRDGKRPSVLAHQDGSLKFSGSGGQYEAVCFTPDGDGMCEVSEGSDPWLYCTSIKGSNGVTTDPCAGINCGSHGSCFSGACRCRDGYTGTTCATAPTTGGSKACTNSKWSEVLLTCDGNPCKALVRTTPFTDCNRYCAQQGHSCLAAFEDKDNTCNSPLWKGDCTVNVKTKFASTSDMICECAPKPNTAAAADMEGPVEQEEEKTPGETKEEIMNAGAALGVAVPALLLPLFIAGL